MFSRHLAEGSDTFFIKITPWIADCYTTFRFQDSMDFSWGYDLFWEELKGEDTDYDTEYFLRKL